MNFYDCESVEEAGAADIITAEQRRLSVTEVDGHTMEAWR
jgi:hypothetical protein